MCLQTQPITLCTRPLSFPVLLGDPAHITCFTPFILWHIRLSSLDHLSPHPQQHTPNFNFYFDYISTSIFTLIIFLTTALRKDIPLAWLWSKVPNLPVPSRKWIRWPIGYSWPWNSIISWVCSHTYPSFPTLREVLRPSPCPSFNSIFVSNQLFFGKYF